MLLGGFNSLSSLLSIFLNHNKTDSYIYFKNLDLKVGLINIRTQSYSLYFYITQLLNFNLIGCKQRITTTMSILYNCIEWRVPTVFAFWAAVCGVITLVVLYRYRTNPRKYFPSSLKIWNQNSLNFPRNAIFKECLPVKISCHGKASPAKWA